MLCRSSAWQPLLEMLRCRRRSTRSEHGERQLQYIYTQGQEPTLLATLEHLFSYAIGGGLEDRVYG